MMLCSHCNKTLNDNLKFCTACGRPVYADLKEKFGFGRFVYLSIYAFLLLACSISVLCIPGYKISLFLYVLQIFLLIYLLKTCCQLFSTWQDKKRKYFLLVQRNRIKFCAYSFEKFMKAPCGRLLTRVVLKDIRQSGRYAYLKKRYCSSFWSQFSFFFKTKTTITIYKKLLVSG